jgi:immune inhibitor A
MRKSLVAAAVAAVASFGVAGAAQAGEPNAKGGHVLPNPAAEKQQRALQRGLELKLAGKIAKGAKVGQVAKGQYVRFAQEGEGRIFVILAEFGNQIHPVTGGTPGPLHDEMTPPNRALDNTTIWFDGGYSPQHYHDLYFDRNPAANSVANYYAAQSSGRYSFTGGVTDWVKVPYNEARYGTNLCGSTVCSTVWDLLKQASDQWVLDQLAAGKTLDQVKAELATYDVEDRYDFDGDGNFTEPDGYLDHFQLIHAGADEAVGGGAQGADAIWSHRWYSNYNLNGSQGPAGNLMGGFEIGAAVGRPTGFWVGDYVMEPENGGVGVIAHETGHENCLPDEYDTGYTGESSAAFWTIMASGSYGNDSTNGIGNKPVDFNAWDKFQLGWLDYDVARPFANGKSALKLGPAETATKQSQAVFVVLPKKNVTTNLGAPYAGEKFYYSGSGDNLDNFMTKAVALPANAQLSAKVRYDIEPDWDYAYVVVSTNNGATWTSVPTNLSTSTDPHGQNKGNGITGSSNGQWVDLTANLSGFSGNVLVGFRYWTDVAATYPGIGIDEVSVAGAAPDGAETDGGWTYKPATGGFRVTTGVESQLYSHYYVLENRQYLGYDNGLGYAYNFGDLGAKPDWAERFPYQDGVLVSYWDTSQTDNNVGEHHGEGLILPIDMHPADLKWSDGTSVRTRIQVYDAPLSTDKTDAITLNRNGVPTTFASLPGVRVFDDRNDYTRPFAHSQSDGGVKTPGTGTVVTLASMDSAGFANVVVDAPKK